MNDLTILINGQRADYKDDKNFPIKFFRSVADYRDPASRKGERTYNFKLPLTENNRRIFGNLQLLELQGKYQTLREREVVVYSGDQQIVRGKFVIDSVTETEISGYILAQVGSVANILKGKSLRDIQSLPDVPFDGIPTVISTTQQLKNGYAPFLPLDYPYSICFPIICYGKFFIPNVWTSSNVNNYLPTQDYIDSAQWLTTINLPEGREISGLQTWFLSFESQPTFAFQDFPPACFLLPVLKAIFEDAGYSVGGKWIEDERIGKLLMPYTGNREPIWNWERMGAMEAQSTPPLPTVETPQDVRLKVTGSRTGTTMTFVRDEWNWDRFYRLSDILYPTGNANDAFNRWFVLYNVLSFIYRFNDPSLSIASASTLDNTGNNAYSIITIPADAKYRFSGSFTIVRNDPDSNVNQLILTRRAFGCTRFQGELPNNYCYGKTFDPAVNNENILYFENMTGEAENAIVQFDFEVELKKGDRIVFWISMMTFYTQFEENAYSNVVAQYTVPPSVFGDSVLINQPPQFTGLYMHTFNYDTAFSIKDFTLIGEVFNLDETEEKSRFGYDLKVAQNLPDVSQSDFVKSLLMLFNLYLYVDDRNKIVTLDTQSDFYLPAQSAYDITLKTNVSTFVSSPPEIGRVYNFIWNKDDNDAVTKIYAGDYNYSIDTSISNTNEVVTVDSGIFASTELRLFSLATSSDVDDFVNPNYATQVQVRIPHMASEDDLKTALNETRSVSYSYQPRLLQVIDVRDFIGDESLGVNCLYFNDITNATTYEKLTDFIELDFNSDPLFANTTPYAINLNWKGDTGLYETYYQNFYTDLAKGYEAECTVLMTATDYLNMQINRPIYYNGNLFILKEISGYDPVRTRNVKVKLVKTG